MHPEGMPEISRGLSDQRERYPGYLPQNIPDSEGVAEPIHQTKHSRVDSPTTHPYTKTMKTGINRKTVVE